MVYTNFCQPPSPIKCPHLWYNEDMLQQLLILFFIGFGLCLIAYFLRSQKSLKYTLNIIGGLLMAIPFALLIYFLFIIFSH